MNTFSPSETKRFVNGSDHIEVRIENSKQQLAWQLVVNGEASHPSNHYSGLLMHKGYVVSTAYWDFKEFVPFKIQYAAVPPVVKSPVDTDTKENAKSTWDEPNEAIDKVFEHFFQAGNTMREAMLISIAIADLPLADFDVEEDAGQVAVRLKNLVAVRLRNLIVRARGIKDKSEELTTGRVKVGENNNG